MGQNRISIGSLTFDHLIKADSYQITPNARQDLDSYRDTEGVLHRNALAHTATIIEFDTVPMWDTEFNAMMSSLTTAYSSAVERKVTITYYDEENRISTSGTFYLDSNWQVKIKQQWGTKVLYDSCHFKFVEY